MCQHMIRHTMAYKKETFYDHITIYPDIFSSSDIHSALLCSCRKWRCLSGDCRSGTDGIYSGVEEKALRISIKMYFLSLLNFIQTFLQPSACEISVHYILMNIQFPFYILKSVQIADISVPKGISATITTFCPYHLNQSVLHTRPSSPENWHPSVRSYPRILLQYGKKTTSLHPFCLIFSSFTVKLNLLFPPFALQ